MEITLTLDPSKLSNPDADLRYAIPEMVEKLSINQLKDDGFDYDDADNMIIYISTESFEKQKAIDVVKEACQNLSLEQEAVTIEVSTK